MKIESYDIKMQSEHFYEKIELESQMSFSSFFSKEPLFVQEQSATQELDLLEPVNSIKSYTSDIMQTLNAIIQSLLSKLNERQETGEEEQTIENNQGMFGYTHFSMMNRFEEHEKLDFSTIGHIQTDKGSLDIDLNFSMSRDFVVENRIDIFSAFDPLVINLNGDIPNLSQKSFSFDLDNDGKSDQISQLASGSGFLALDKNQDGEINQGSELFGTLSGDGFGELSEYDKDGNQWIDENDSIFDSLQIWLKNEDTKEKELVGLGEVGIGAIFLGSSAADFSYKTAQNETLGEMKSCGIFLNEDGSCGNISQIDLASRGEKEEPLAQLLQA